MVDSYTDSLALDEPVFFMFMLIVALNERADCKLTLTYEPTVFMSFSSYRQGTCDVGSTF